MKKSSFDELVSQLTWRVIENLLHGESLRSSIYTVCVLVLDWSKEQKQC